MSISFENLLVAGVTLIREAIQSQNFVQGVAGWQVKADGSAEFSDLTIRSSDGSGATVVIENGTAEFTAANGWKIIIDPTLSLPVIYFLDGDGDVAGAINATGNNAQAGLIVSSGPFADGAISDWRWITFMGQNSGGNAWYAQRLRDSDPSTDEGGFAFLDNDAAQVGISSSLDANKNTFLQVTDDLFVMEDGRLLLSPTPGALPALWVNVLTAGQTGNLLHLQREGDGKFVVDIDGNVTALGNIEALGSIRGDNIRTGTATTPAPPAGGGTTSIAVTFSSPMNGTPSVTIDPRTTGDPATLTIRGYVDNVTSSGFTIRGYRSNNVATLWNWTAVAA